MTTALVPLAFLRLLLAFSPIPAYLTNNHQLTSPLTSYARLKEGVFLLKHGISPYAGGLVRHTPLQLSLFSTLLPPHPVLLHIVWTTLDVVSAWGLSRIWAVRSGKRDRRRETIVQVCYLLNPYLIFPSLALSTSTLDNALGVFTLLSASKGRIEPTFLLLALLTHSSLYSSLLFPPLAVLLLSGPQSRLAEPSPFTNWKGIIKLAAIYAGYMLALAGISTLAVGELGWVKETWGATLTVPDLTPNVGLWWYFFTEMFDHFRSFFLMVFTALVVVAVIPLTIKFQHDPLYALYLVTGNVAIFKSYPTMADSGLFLSLLSVFPEVWSHLRHPLPTLLWHIYASTLLPLFNNLWLGQGTGNSNFFYAATLVFGVANGAVLLDGVWAGLSASYEMRRDGRYGGKEDEGEEKEEGYSLVQI